MFDCTDFRTEDKDDLLRQIYEMTDRRFALANHLLETQPWDFFVMVEMGVDRIYHGFWKAMDPRTGSTFPETRYESAIKDYHRHVDRLLAKVIEHADDETVILVVSDHGGKRMEGGIRINEWLRREGLLATLREPTEVTTLDTVGVDWPRTTAWGEGGYYSRHLPERARTRARGHRPGRGLRAGSRRARAPTRGDPRRSRPADGDAGLTNPKTSTRR